MQYTKTISNIYLAGLEDYLKAAEQQRTIFRQASAQSTQSLTPQVDKILSPPTIQYKPKDQEHAPRRIYMLPRRQSPGDTQSGPSSVVWEIRLEYDFSLDTSKLTPNKPEDCYYVRGSDNEYHTLNINRKPSVSPSYLEYYLQDISGIALPVLQIMSRPSAVVARHPYLKAIIEDSDYWATDPKPRLELSHKSEYG
ncbi:hypothetical protein H0H93_004903 [Arthromyces matolae]|nr:hypothetical protein H0H93_004903 [Arthromyces matolae]